MKQPWKISSNGIITRQKRIQYPNGDVYEGGYLNGKWNGEGTFTSSSNGNKYVGSFKDGFFHGKGTLESNEWNGQCKYEGFFENGKRCGRGIFVDALGNKLDGSWINDAFIGQGQVIQANGDKLVGEFKNGKLECETSIIEFANGDRYEGPCHAGKMDGCLGKYVFKGSQACYEGSFRRGLKHGKGTFCFGDGSIFQGDFDEEAMTGYGTFEYSKARSPFKAYKGNFDNGQFHGDGKLIYDAVYYSSYTGSFAFGSFHGFGKVLYSDGGFYEGDFKMAKRHGHGTRHFSSGVTFVGTWSEDEMVMGIRTEGTSYYIGEFASGQKSGRGREIWEMTDHQKLTDPSLSWLFKCKGLYMYEGEYKNGNFDGEGKFFAPCGRKYEGSWKMGRPYGFGHAVLLSKDERGSLYRPYKYVGQWVDGKRHGHGTVYFLMDL